MAPASEIGTACWATVIAGLSRIVAAVARTAEGDVVDMRSKGASFAPSSKPGRLRATRRIYGRRPAVVPVRCSRSRAWPHVQRESAVERIRPRAGLRHRTPLPQYAGPALRILAAGAGAGAPQP